MLILPNSVRFLADHMFRIFCKEDHFASKFPSIAASWLYEKSIPSACIGSSGHLIPKGFCVFCLLLPSHSPSVFAAFNSSPLHSLNVSNSWNNLFAEFLSARKQVVSSAYWLNFTSFWCILITFISLSLLIALANISSPIMNGMPDRRQPCLTPLSNFRDYFYTSDRSQTLMILSWKLLYGSVLRIISKITTSVNWS